MRTEIGLDAGVNNEIWIFDKESDQFNGNIFYSFEAAEEYVITHGGYRKYDIFEKLS